MPSKSMQDRGKEAAGIQAAGLVRPGMRLGLGTGSTVAFFLDALARRLKDGELGDIVGVPTSLRTDARARELGIPLTTLAQTRTLDLTVDGADEVDPALDLIKGMGGALVREKMVAQATEHLVIIIDEGKLVDQLGTRSPLPVEVLSFGWESHLDFLEKRGAVPELRMAENDAPYRTDNGNFILNCRFPGGISDPGNLETALNSRAGIVGTGLFLGMAREVLVGKPSGVSRLQRPGKGVPGAVG